MRTYSQLTSDVLKYSRLLIKHIARRNQSSQQLGSLRQAFTYRWCLEFLYCSALLTKRRALWISLPVECETSDHHRWRIPWRNTTGPKWLECQMRSHSDPSFTSDWKHECICTRHFGLSDSIRTRFSIITHSTSSSWTTMSFLRIFIAYNSPGFSFRSARTTWIRIEV